MSFNAKDIYSKYFDLTQNLKSSSIDDLPNLYSNTYSFLNNYIDSYLGEGKSKLKELDRSQKTGLVDVVGKINNSLIDTSKKFISNDLPDLFASDYNKQIDFLRDKVGIKSLNNINNKKMAGALDVKTLKNSYINNLVQNLEYTENGIEQKLEFINKFLGINLEDETQNIAKTFKPRITLPQKLIPENEKKHDEIIKQLNNKYNGMISLFQNETDKLFKGEITENKLINNFTNKLKEFYPTGKVPIIFTKKNGETGLRHNELNWYVETWNQYTKQTSTNFATLTTARISGNDIVEWLNYYLGCKICAPYIGKKYSISGNSKQYPALGITPSVHTFCHCLLVVSPQIEKGKVVETVQREKINDVLKNPVIITPKDARAKLLKPVKKIDEIKEVEKKKEEVIKEQVKEIEKNIKKKKDISVPKEIDLYEDMKKKLSKENFKKLNDNIKNLKKIFKFKNDIFKNEELFDLVSMDSIAENYFGKDFVNARDKVLQMWTGSSEGGYSLKLQNEIKKNSKLKSLVENSMDRDKAKTWGDEKINTFGKEINSDYVINEYNFTQMILKKVFGNQKTIKLYRGLNLQSELYNSIKAEEDRLIISHPLNSYSINKSSGADFSAGRNGYLINEEIETKKIFSFIGMSPYYVRGEFEFVVLNKNVKGLKKNIV